MPNPVVGILGATSAYSSYKSGQAADSASSAADAQTMIAGQQVAMAQDQYDRYKTLYGPAEEQLIAASAPSQQKVNQAQGLAGRDVMQAYEKVKQSRAQQMGRFGIDPSSAKYQQQMSNVQRDQAAAMAGSRIAAGEREQDKQFAKLQGTVSVGRGIPSQAAGMYGSAAGAYGSAGSAQAGLASAYGNDASNGLAAIGTNLAGGGFGLGNFKL